MWNCISKISTATLVLAGFVFLPQSSFAHNLTTDEEINRYKFPEEMEKNYPYYLSGYDDDGAPVWVFEYGKWDVRTMVDRGGPWFNHMDVWFDKMMLTFRDSAKDSEGKDFIGIADLEGWDLRQAGNLGTVSLIFTKFSAAERLFPISTIKHVFIVNANYLFDSLFERGRSLLGGIGQKIDVYGTNKAKWIPKVLRLVPKDQLPEWLGGSKDWSPILVKG